MSGRFYEEIYSLLARQIKATWLLQIFCTIRRSNPMKMFAQISQWVSAELVKHPSPPRCKALAQRAQYPLNKQGIYLK